MAYAGSTEGSRSIYLRRRRQLRKAASANRTAPDLPEGIPGRAQRGSLARAGGSVVTVLRALRLDSPWVQPNAPWDEGRSWGSRPARKCRTRAACSVCSKRGPVEYLPSAIRLEVLSKGLAENPKRCHLRESTRRKLESVEGGARSLRL